MFHEGYLHGFYSVQAIKKHRGLLATLGHRRIHRASYATLLANLEGSFAGQQWDDARCYFVFNTGKKLGKLVGSIRFGHINL